ncbi:MAG: GAF domain-containing protein, partial [Planctomycetes bacterium]|nr:GAF domain-containing protein [Planctomycetota bacterium]
MAQGDSPEVKRRLEELSLLHDVSQILDQTLDLREVSASLVELVADKMGLKRVTVSLFNRQTGEISIEAAHGMSSTQKERGRYRIGEGITGKVVESGKGMIVPRISKEPLFLNRTDSKKAFEKEDAAFICVPIRVSSEVVGTLSAFRDTGEQAELEEDNRLLRIIASMVAQAVKLRQQIEEERQRLLEENERLQNELKERFRPTNIIGNSKAMQDVYDLLAQVA